MKEKLSAIIDGELEGGIQAHITRMRSDPELRAAWDTYHLIGDALRGHLCREIAPRVISRLREEPTMLAPRQRAASAVKRFGWYGMYATASAAAVATLSERMPGCIGINSRASAAAWTASGAPADSRPNNSTSSGAKRKSR